jgi:hypothetical protein
MAKRHFYIGIENLALNATQRQALVQELRALGPASGVLPAHLNHWRIRLDGEAAIFEALFNQINQNNLTTTRFKQRLAAIFGVDPTTIDHVVANHSFAGGTTPVVTFSRSGTDYLRFALFGGREAGWQQSGDECRGYLAANRNEWEPLP